MSISKHFLLEQLNRCRAIDADEINGFEYTSNDKDDENWWVWHDRGHFYVLEHMKGIILKNNYTKKSLLKELRKLDKTTNMKIKEIESKYEKYNTDLDNMELKDKCKYAFNDGVSCQCYNFGEVVRGHKYYDKSSYKNTNWKELMKIK
jgi:hypothetical protein